MANAFACRSAHLPARRVGLTGNRLLLAAVLTELALLAAFLFVGPLASLLEQAPPSLAGWAVVILTGPAVLFADGLDKTLRARARRAVAGA